MAGPMDKAYLFERIPIRKAVQKQIVPRDHQADDRPDL